MNGTIKTTFSTIYTLHVHPSQFKWDLNQQINMRNFDKQALGWSNPIKAVKCSNIYLILYNLNELDKSHDMPINVIPMRNLITIALKAFHQQGYELTYYHALSLL